MSSSTNIRDVKPTNEMVRRSNFRFADNPTGTKNHSC